MDNGKGIEKIDNPSINKQLQDVVTTIYFKSTLLGVMGTLIVVLS